MNKIVIHPELFEQGLQEAADLVASTIGPFGGNVSIAGGRERLSFDDGFKAIQAYQPGDVQKMEAVRRIHDALLSQLKSCGDGTSTTTLLLVSLYFEARKLVNAGHRERDVVRAFQALTEQVCEELDKMAIKATIDVNGQEKGDPALLTKVATIAMHGDEKLGRLIGELVADLGRYGMIGAEIGSGSEIEVVRTTGYAWKAGVPDEVFFNTHGSARFGESLVLLVNESCDDIQSPFWNKVLETWQQVCAQEQKELGLILISRGATGSVMSTFARATHQKSGKRMPMCILKPPGENDAECVAMLNDIAVVTGGAVFDKLRGRIGKADFDASQFGRVAGVNATLNNSSLKLMEVFDRGFDTVRVETERDNLVTGIQIAMSENKEDSAFQEYGKKRIANLTGAVATIRFPVVSETQFSELQEQMEDGYRSAMSALDGVLPGGGKALTVSAEKAIKAISVFDKDMSIDVPAEKSIIGKGFLDALRVPVFLLYSESKDPDFAVTHKDGGWYAFDLYTERYGNAVELGILDSLNVVKSALRNAMSVAMPLVNTKRWLVIEP